MAQYKVPQDVEADDKLLGPFSFRQFVYLLIAGGLAALAVGLFQLFPLLAIIPVPFILLLVALALPLKKDQPMETYLAALVSYYLKPRTRFWTPGQKDSTITVTAPKKVEESRTREMTGEEATHRLSFLADIVDTEGYAIKGPNMNMVNDELVAEANATSDIFETNHFDRLGTAINKDETERHEEVMREMKEEIKKVEDKESEATTNEINENVRSSLDDELNETSQNEMSSAPKYDSEGPNFDSDVVIKPIIGLKTENVENVSLKANEKRATIKAKPSIIELANNTDFSVATIAKEANRIKERNEGEVFISLH
ncbi:PrgI family protein [Candidatus Saccharibacteria bacterium]|nr:PrgI family protein [Candidatus Saccharibacteria bacterium]